MNEYCILKTPKFTILIANNDRFELINISISGKQHMREMAQNKIVTKKSTF
jgi:hypothetical protein